MNLPEDTRLAYTVWQEAWFYDPRNNEEPFLMVSAAAKGGGVAWEFQIDGYELGGNPVTRVKMFDDSYAALAQLPEFFAALAEQQPGTLDEVRALLGSLGAVDETPRVSPYSDRPPASRVTFSLAEVRDGTRWPRGARFALVADTDSNEEG
jgi:hypothetical protein